MGTLFDQPTTSQSILGFDHSNEYKKKLADSMHGLSGWINTIDDQKYHENMTNFTVFSLNMLNVISTCTLRDLPDINDDLVSRVK